MLSKELKKNGIGDLSNSVELSDEWPLWDGSSHFMSATIMSNNINQGVVDSNCKAHDLNNLYIAGPSVFQSFICKSNANYCFIES